MSSPTLLAGKNPYTPRAVSSRFATISDRSFCASSKSSRAFGPTLGSSKMRGITSACSSQAGRTATSRSTARAPRAERRRHGRGPVNAGAGEMPPAASRPASAAFEPRRSKGAACSSPVSVLFAGALLACGRFFAQNSSRGRGPSRRPDDADRPRRVEHVHDGPLIRGRDLRRPCAAGSSSRRRSAAALEGLRAPSRGPREPSRRAKA